MKDLFGPHAVLFESELDGEGLRIECITTPEGRLAILQESDGPLTSWCFEESPHRIETEVGVCGVKRLMGYFELEEAEQLPAVLRMRYTGYDCGQRIRSLMRDIDVPYRVREHQPLR